MCGISGILSNTCLDSLEDDLYAMTSIVAHRGPDDEGMVFFNSYSRKILEKASLYSLTNDTTFWNAGLGHRRLSIIDLTFAGHQPMSDASGRYWMVYNGEVYNYVEVRDQLKLLGRTFRSQTDSEVILQAFIEWGADCLSRLNGMWAFTIFDRHNGSFFCARDRYGIKPFYYAFKKGIFAFASEIKQLLELSWVGNDANRDILADFFLWGQETHTQETFFENVHSLPGSHYLEISLENLDDVVIAPNCYWEPSVMHSMDDKHAIEAFRDLLSDSVRIRLRSDVPIGFTLSGGLDSSSLLCLAGEQKRMGGQISSLDAFNVDFDDPGYSERHFAEAAAKTAGAKMVLLQPGHMDLARDWKSFVWHMEEPFGGLSYFSNFLIYRLIRKHNISVVLSGQGADELLLGYDRYRANDAFIKIRSMKPFPVLKDLLDARLHANMSFKTQLIYGLYFSWPMLRAIRRRHLLQPILNRDFFHEYADKTKHLRATMIHKDLGELQRSDLFHYQLPHLLRHEDRVSMANSVETRLPFLDYRLLELVLGQSSSLLFRDGWSKYILRQAMTGILPYKIQQRNDKMGFSTPTRRLIQQNKDLFIPLLARHRNDSVVNVVEIERLFESERLNEGMLCGAVSYLSWKEAFNIT